MGARSGNNYLSALRKFGADIRSRAERIGDPTVHRALSRRADAIASMYDEQMEHPEAMTFRTGDGSRAGYSLCIPKTADELRRRSRMFKAWADFSGGMMMETPDIANAAIAAMAAASQWFAQSEPAFADNIRTYHGNAISHDSCASLAVGDRTATGDDSALRIVERRADGIVIRGRRSGVGLAPIAEELIVLPDVAQAECADDEAQAVCFAINCNARGLRFECDDLPSQSQSVSEAPLAARFDEPECTAVFDDVLIPADRVFICGDTAGCAAMLSSTGVRAHLIHQASIRRVSKLEFIAGAVAGMIKLADSDGAAATCLAELRDWVEAMRALILASEAQAATDRWGAMRPDERPLSAADNLFRRAYPRLIETVSRLGASLDSGDGNPDARSLATLVADLTTNPFGARNLAREVLFSAGIADAAQTPIADPMIEQSIARLRAIVARPG